MDGIVTTIAVIGVLGIGAQWVAWRLRLPAIVLMAAAGLLAGPVLELVDPASDFGDLLRPLIAVAVAIILFDGGLSLKLREFREIKCAIWRLVLIGAPLAWVLTALAARHVAGLSWPVALLFGGILVVTGPTVIVPLLRQAKLSARPAAVLKWEGIVNDPVGALLAVLVYEVVAHAGRGEDWTMVGLGLAAGAAVAAAIGIGGGRALALLFKRGAIPEFLKAPAMLCTVLVAFVAANALAEESGLLAVTALGITFGNARIASIEQMRRFKESIAILLVSGVFVVLTAMLDAGHLRQLTWGHVGFVALLLAVVRPASVAVATIGSRLTWRERLLVAWIAPRGIVAVAVSGLFGLKLAELGHADGALLVPLSFAVVFATVIAHGFTIGPAARLLGLVAAERPGLLVVGATPWSIELARVLGEFGIPVTIADRVWHRLRRAREAGLATYYGEILSEVTEHRLDLNGFGFLIAASENDAYNALVCTDLAPDLGRSNVFQLNERHADDPNRLSFTLGGRTLFRAGMGAADLDALLASGWRFQKTRLTDEFGLDAYEAVRHRDAQPVFVLKGGKRLSFARPGKPLRAQAGDVVVAFGPPEAP
ncbi:MAG: sodium:proton antiporter [Pseudomonadota bacterium]